MFGPLEFDNGELRSTPGCPANDDWKDVECILCDKGYHFPDQRQQLLEHIFQDHRLVIADVDDIPDLPSYLTFWRSQMFYSDIKEYCSTFLVDVQKDGTVLNNQEYYLLSDILPMDREIRNNLQRQKLENALEQQAKERDDRNYKHSCLFCRKDVMSSRAEYINHLSIKHNLQLGQPDNLVYIDKFLSIIEAKIDNLQCIFCEKFFKDRAVLKEHMRKKQHKRVNPNNKLYDQFYMINYLEADSRLKNKRRDSFDGEDPCDWSDWEENFQVSIVCLFCEEVSNSWEDVMYHMNQIHRFQYEKNVADLTFYDQVKLVNYIRRQIYRHRCITCDLELENNGLLLEHMTREKHLIMPTQLMWDQPE
ncbi:hypothetical protein AAG570_011853 [Ranatra chinensis]|uniref:C2H2-type domain-containing protein n=1 Tax=Ranatra chinensis TaxID=642074 RepID=A0ABD0YHE5_9HEMI